MRVAKFSEWAAKKHPSLAVNEGMWRNSAEDRLGALAAADRATMAKPKDPSGDPRVRKAAGEFLDDVRRLIHHTGATRHDVQQAIDDSGVAAIVSPRQAQALFLSAFLEDVMAVPSVSKAIVSLIDSVKSVTGTLKNALDKVTHHLTRSIGSGPAATPLA